MKVLILRPRLDVTFKGGPVPKERGPIPPIREHWDRVIHMINYKHYARGDTVKIDERPLWQFTPENIEQEKYDLIYVPHRESHSFPLPEGKARYYMQSVFPHMFYIDPKGFAGGASFYPMDLTDAPFGGLAMDMLSCDFNRGISKFDQPEMQEPGIGNYVLFTCQIPHDQTIKFHSDIGVAEALRRTIEAVSPARTLVVKGHPVNPESMLPLREICNKHHNVIYIDNVNIHSVIKNAAVVVTVNSGTGMEALLHKKPVITFGRCEYDCVTMPGYDSSRLSYFIKNPEYDEVKVQKFFNAWTNRMYNSQLSYDFRKLS